MAEQDAKSLEVQEKQELSESEEKTAPTRYYVPPTDIFENDDAITVVMEIPGVKKDDLHIHLKDDKLSIEGEIDFTRYEKLHPVYTEYNIGHYSRAFTLSSKVDQEKIAANVSDGVLTLTLPKAEEAKPRRIQIN